ncbi:hypothetical protein D9613_010449 [Agrocybe pediades]|uniref:Cytochrome P450 n=1 Tax=Agrocybe pediades TaxID=84607 RepID=A0A8H4QFB7_9AGAR|nr:hypothetical protein D9613_010449 [Agrocybe pediades]
MVDANSTSCLLLIILAWTVYYLLNKLRAHGHNYPPGPRYLPIIGNLLDLAKLHGSTGYQRLAKEFGDIVFLSSFGKNILVVNSSKTAHELFEKRSSTYSCRPQSVMSHELIGWDFSFAHMPYGERWNVHRRMFHREFQQSAATAYHPIQAEEAHALLRNLLQNPENWESYLRHNAAAIIMSVTYGLKVAPTDDMYVSLAEKALEGVGMAASPSGFLVDFFPFLKHVPDWIPGASFRKKAREWHAATIGMKDIPFEAVLEELKMGKAAPSFVSNLLNEQEPEKNGEVEIIKNCAAVIYAAAAESV